MNNTCQNAGVESAGLYALQELLTRESGMEFEHFRGHLLASRVTRRLRQLQLGNPREYLDFLQERLRRNDREELNHLVSELTVNETSFFRDPDQFRFLTEAVFPRLADQDEIAVLSVGCATGEEAFSAAMALQDYFLPSPNRRITVTACDIDQEVLARCGTLVYPADSRHFEAVPAPLRRRYFEETPEGFTVSQRLRQAVRFFPLNLATQSLPGVYDVIFCKNVMIYFTDAVKETVTRKLAAALRPKGVLLVGATEFLETPPPELGKVSYPGGIAYQRQPPPPRPAAPRPPVAPESERHATEVVPLSGVIDAEEAPQDYTRFCADLNRCLDAERPVILDLAAVQFISRDSLGKIVRVIRHVRKRRQDLVMVAPRNNVRALLERRHLDRLVTFYDTLPEALGRIADEERRH